MFFLNQHVCMNKEIRNDINICPEGCCVFDGEVPVRRQIWFSAYTC